MFKNINTFENNLNVYSKICLQNIHSKTTSFTFEIILTLPVQGTNRIIKLKFISRN